MPSTREQLRGPFERTAGMTICDLAGCRTRQGVPQRRMLTLADSDGNMRRGTPASADRVRETRRSGHRRLINSKV